MEYRPMVTNTPSDSIVKGYLDCAEWCGLMDEDREALELSVSPRWSEATLIEADAICLEFMREFYPKLSSLEMDDGCAEQAGMDLWLTRNRHGAGFWAGDWPEPFASEATDWSHAYGEANVMLDPDTEILEIV